MALAALIAAYQESAEPGALRAALPLAGRTVLERQARLAHAAGARRIIVLVERMPAALTAALDRLRREGLPLQVARGVEEAAAAIEPEDRLLVIADGAIADGSQLDRLAVEESAIVLTVPDSTHGELYERIDAHARWSGLAAIDGAMLKSTAAMLRDWDLQSTLLRRTLQAGARHLPADAPVAMLDSLTDVAQAERQILEGARAARGGWAARMLAPLERTATSLLMATPVTTIGVGTAGAVLTGLGAVFLGYAWLWTGLILMLLATPLEGIALRLARLRMQPDARRAWWRHLLDAFGGAGLIGLSYSVGQTYGWGMILLGFVTLAFMIALEPEKKARRPRGRIALAGRKNLIWLLLPAALAGGWHLGLALLAAYAAASFFWAQHEAHGARPNGAGAN
ncbi:hypothetical protein RCO27_16720 [Sphingosinicella sp. LHD-64]|uniref:hypothetical protein n=1 Tax=Sphingosinicella sp. LHD-64 TaxID=3072139 RepID=UPI00280D9020|nr:hypothetical protein [Sphingosinicella sp. LHD-64]MDQ8757872.1 hypothetical protein [Sphingosinicella sp. LHD-64]